MKTLFFRIGKSLLAQGLAVSCFAIVFALSIFQRPGLVAPGLDNFFSLFGFVFVVFGLIGLPILALSTFFHLRLFKE